MAKFRIMDRTLALRCRNAWQRVEIITVSFWNGHAMVRATGYIQSVKTNTTRRAKPHWEVEMLTTDELRKIQEGVPEMSPPAARNSPDPSRA